jgi:NADPH:quinone reductase-like Zn-dependent oxidoreductase
MKAFVLRAYGSPEQLELQELAKPVPAAGEVLVRVRATSVNPADWHLMRGEPWLARLMPAGLGLRGPRVTVLGCDVAGQVEAVGPDVTRFKPGDDVYALLTGGGFGEYVSVPERLLAAKPRNLSYEQAAAVPMAAVTALVSLCDTGGLQPGQAVLVTGASGGVGSFAVQIAHALGARVTGVCRGRNAELVRSIGADDVVDYQTQDFTRTDRRYDLIVDAAGSRPVSACRRVLTRRGVFVVVGGPAGRWVRPADRVFAALLQKPFVSQRMAVAAVTGRDQAKDLARLTELIESGKVTPVIDRRYPFAELPAAVAYQEQGHVPGKIVVTLEHPRTQSV